MKNNFHKILNELSYRVSTGIPDLRNEQHLMKLWDILKEHNWSVDARVKLLKRLDEQGKERLCPICEAMCKHGETSKKTGCTPASGPASQVDTDKDKPKKDDKDKSKEVKDFEDRLEKNIFLTEEQKELARDANKKIEVIYDDNATPEQKIEAVNWLLENMKLSTNAKTKSNKRTISKAPKQQINHAKYSNLKHCLKSVKSKEELQVAEMTRKFDPHHALGYQKFNK